MKFVYKKEFIKRFDLCSVAIQELILDTIKQIKTYLENQEAFYGLRIKKIGPKTFEARVTDKIRVIWIKEENIISFALLGNHEEVRRFIKQIR